MAKRKRLSPANVSVFGAPAEGPPSIARAPIADVAADAAATAALADLSQELAEARAQGRMVLSLPVDTIVMDHMVRDRVVIEDAEMEALMASIAARGQQSPIEVLEVAPGQYGLISGWRRCQAIQRLAEHGRHDGQVLALLRKPADASATYQAMVEENEIRVGLSYFERARIAAKAVEVGVFETDKAALLTLFASASRAKRSKIRSFLPLVAAFDGHLRYPHLIGERLGLKLSAALETDLALADRVRAALEAAQVDTAEAEQAVLTRALAGGRPVKPKRARSRTGHQTLLPGLDATWEEGWLRLEGDDLTPALRIQILDYIRSTLHR